MNYEVAPLVLYSQDRTRMLNFMSDVFEFEVNNKDYSVHCGGLFFQIENNQDNIEQIADNRVMFSFRIDSEDELDEIINKYNFFRYRREGSAFLENVEVGESSLEKFVIIYDLDARPWKFFFKKDS